MHYRIKDLPESERPREKLEKRGANYLSNVELLAIVLRTGSKEKSALTLAQELINKYSNLASFKYLTIDELLEVKGIGRTKAIQLLATIELASRINGAVIERGYQIKSPSECAEYIAEEIKQLEQEHFIGIYLDAKNRILAKKVLFKGTLTRANVSPIEVFKEALRHGCASIIVVHNHPSGVRLHRA